jgi:hypothetical protein
MESAERTIGRGRRAIRMPNGACAPDQRIKAHNASSFRLDSRCYSPPVVILAVV